MTFEDFSSAVYGAFRAYDLGSFSCDPVKLRAIFDAVRGGKVVAELGPYEYDRSGFRYPDGAAVSITYDAEMALGPQEERARYRLDLIELPEGSDQ